MNIKIIKNNIITKDKKKLPIIYYINKNNNNKKNKVILVISEIFGLNNHIKYICKKLSKNNYICVSPQLFFRIKNIKFNEDINILRNKINKLSDKIIIKDLNNLIKWIKKKFKTNNIYMIGLSWGGRITWLYSYLNKEKIKKSIVLYGRINNIKDKKHPIHPLDFANNIKIPVLGIYAKNDKIIPKKDIYNFKKNIKNKNIKLIIYDKCEHSFLDKKSKSYNKNVSKKTWNNILNWFNYNNK